MACKCGGERFIALNAKCSDRCFASVYHLSIERDGYVPNITGVGGGDYIEIDVCLDCGLLQGFEPLTDEEVSAIVDPD